MKRVIYLAGGLVVALMVAASAHATGNSNSSGNVTNNYDQRDYGGNTSNAGGNGYGGQGGNGYGGAGGSVLGSGNSSNTNLNSANAAQGQGQAQQATGGAATSTSNATGGSSFAAGGNGSGNATNAELSTSTGLTSTTSVTTNYAAPVIPKPSSANAYAPEGSAPRTSCRIFVGIGGTGRDGSLSGGIPVGNDQTCLSGAQVEFMNNVNRVAPGTFTGADYLLAACKVEGMDQMAACKK